MDSMDELKKKVESLSRSELSEFRDWFKDYDNLRWDQEMEEDAASGKLDKLAAEALAEYDAGKARKL